MSRLFIQRGQAQTVLAMGHSEPPRFHKRPGRFASNEPGWRSLPVEGTAHWRRLQAADRRARRVKLLLILGAALVGVALFFLKG
jgi:hypothetical protein